jgi:hypothetical protein
MEFSLEISFDLFKIFVIVILVTQFKEFEIKFYNLTGAISILNL